MKKLSSILVLFVYFIPLVAQNNSAKCEMYEYYGETRICLPKIAGMTECYSAPIVKRKASRVFNGRGMVNLGFYLPNEIYEKIDILDEIPFDGFFLIYGQENMKNIKGDVKDLDKVAEIMKNTFYEIEWDLDDVEIENKLINVGKPVLLEIYSPHERVRSFIGLTYGRADNEEYIGLSIMNMVIIKEKLITVTFYQYYKDEESVNKARAKNDYIVLRLLDENS